MRKILWVFVLFWAIGFTCLAEAGIFDDIMKELPGANSGVSRPVRIRRRPFRA